MLNSSTANLFSQSFKAPTKVHPVLQAAEAGRTSAFISNFTKNIIDNSSNFLQIMTKEIQDERQNTRFEDGRLTNVLFDRVQVADIVSLAMVLISVSLTVLQYELEFAETEGTWSTVMLYFIFFSSLILCFTTVVRHYFDLQYLQARELISTRGAVLKLSYIFPIIFEVLFAMVIPYPWIQGRVVTAYSLYDNVPFYYHQNEILSFFSILRIVIVFRILLLNAYWTSNRAQRLCKMASVPSGTLFTLKCVMKTNPFTLIFTAYLSSIPLFAYMLRIAESPLTRFLEDVPTFSYPNAMWNVIITISTVGYGDFYPQTLLGRGIIFFVCIWGTVIISLMVVVVTNLFQLSQPEENMLNLLERLKLKETMKREAGSMLVSFIRGKKVSKATGRVSQQHLHGVKKHFKNFKKASKDYRDLTQSAVGFEDMERYFEDLRDQMVDARKDIDFLVNSVKTILKTPENDIKGPELGAESLKSSIVSTKKAPEPKTDLFPTKDYSESRSKIFSFDLGAANAEVMFLTNYLE